MRLLIYGRSRTFVPRMSVLSQRAYQWSGWVFGDDTVECRWQNSSGCLIVLPWSAQLRGPKFILIVDVKCLYIGVVAIDR